MPFLSPQSDTCKCSGGLPVQVTTGARRMGISKNFRAARGLQNSQQAAGIVRKPGLGDLSTLPQDFANGDWLLVAGDLLPWVAVAWIGMSILRGFTRGVRSRSQKIQRRRKRIAAAKAQLKAAQAGSWF